MSRSQKGSRGPSQRQLRVGELIRRALSDILMRGDVHEPDLDGISVTVSGGKPYGIANIYRTLKVGSGNAAHINRFFCVPRAQYLGVTPQDIIDYKLPTHPLKEVDVKRAKDALKNDPFFKRHKPWQKAIAQLLKMGVRAEQQALAKHGLNYVIETYLPEQLDDIQIDAIVAEVLRSGYRWKGKTLRSAMVKTTD